MDMTRGIKDRLVEEAMAAQAAALALVDACLEDASDTAVILRATQLTQHTSAVNKMLQPIATAMVLESLPHGPRRRR